MGDNLHQAQSHEVLRSWQSQRNDINHHKDFVLPLFIGNDDDKIEPIEAMPDVYRYGCNRAIEYLEPLVYSFGLRAILLFPVITKTDQKKVSSKHALGEDDDEPADSDNEVISSTNSSDSRSSSPSSGSSAEDDGCLAPVLPERLLPADDAGSASNSQNPFLNENEEEDHLLGEQNDRTREEESMPVAPTPPIPPRPGDARKTSKSLDIKLIKSLALKDEHNPVLRLIPKLRAKFPQLLIICDVCLCAFTSTGHCCLFNDHPPTGAPGGAKRNGGMGYHNHQTARPGGSSLAGVSVNHYPISNKITCQYLALLSVEYALRGCNVVAPSDMMDGRIQSIRDKLDELQLSHVSIMSYSAKFASAFYGPFRNATNNAPEFGDRRAYQLPPGSRALALKAVRRDIKQGADIVMVKPGGHYLDIVRDIRESNPDFPIAIYQVSGEYSMLKMAAKANILDLKLAVNEVLTSYRRAGATIIISYFTPELLRGELKLSDVY